MLNPLTAISPIDGRYRAEVEALSPYFSERALMRHRLLVEVEYFIMLAGHPQVTFLRALAADEQRHLRALYEDFGDEAAGRIKAIEAGTRHDVKAVEYYLREQLAGTSLDGLQEGIHFGLTSEDVNNLAYALCLRDGLAAVISPALDGLHDKLRALAEAYAALPMLARTHGQPASPTTLGKELAVFVVRLDGQRATLADLHGQLPGKLNGATGNFNAHYAAYPGVDWIAFSRDFITGLGLRPTLLTTQIEPGDTLVALCHALARINTILLDFAQDMWRYIGDGYFAQQAVQGEVGSSTMPHKVNPIHFENAEGNLEIANALFGLFARRLPISRLQRDLSNSTVLRNLGVALAHCLLAYQNLRRGLERAQADEARLDADLRAHWEVVTEGIQTILRREGITDAYDLLKGMSRGAGALTQADIEAFVRALDVSDAVKAELLALTPETYTGAASRLAMGRGE